jgi:hypothetical protein
MTTEPGYPVTLVHPQHKPAVNTTDPDARTGKPGQQGSPEQFPQVTVHGVVHEAEYRALGYLRFGEPVPVKMDHHEYPKMMVHPDHVPAVETRTEAKLDPIDRVVKTYTIPGKPAVMPDLIVQNAEQEEKARARGYHLPGEYDKAALEAVLHGVPVLETYAPDQYPKWVDGVLIEKDPDAVEPWKPDARYPRYEDGVLVYDPKMPPKIDPNKYPMWVHKETGPSDESELAETPTREFEIRQKWARAAAAAEKARQEAEAEQEDEPAPAPAKKPAKPSDKVAAAA